MLNSNLFFSWQLTKGELQRETLVRRVCPTTMPFSISLHGVSLSLSLSLSLSIDLSTFYSAVLSYRNPLFTVSLSFVWCVCFFSSTQPFDSAWLSWYNAIIYPFPLLPRIEGGLSCWLYFTFASFFTLQLLVMRKLCLIIFLVFCLWYFILSSSLVSLALTCLFMSSSRLPSPFLWDELIVSLTCFIRNINTTFHSVAGYSFHLQAILDLFIRSHRLPLLRLSLLLSSCFPVPSYLLHLPSNRCSSASHVSSSSSSFLILFSSQRLPRFLPRVMREERALYFISPVKCILSFFLSSPRLLLPFCRLSPSNPTHRASSLGQSTNHLTNNAFVVQSLLTRRRTTSRLKALWALFSLSLSLSSLSLLLLLVSFTSSQIATTDALEFDCSHCQ